MRAAVEAIGLGYTMASAGPAGARAAKPSGARIVTLSNLMPIPARLRFLITFAIATAALFPRFASAAAADATNSTEFAFTVAGDMRQFVNGTPDKRLFDGACAAMKRVGPGAFLVTPGDFDPPAPVRAALNEHLGAAFPWYVVVGNHEVETEADMQWVREWAGKIPNLVRKGPPGFEYAMYSFDYANSHFVAIDTYPAPKPAEKKKGPVDVTDAMFEWLEADLAANQKPMVWVIGHQPLESQPDMESSRNRHDKESVTTNPDHKARFLALLHKYHVRGYLCGHTHNASVVQVGGIWQADSGHARGAGDVGSPSTFLKVRVNGERAWVDVYRMSEPTGRDYVLRKTVELTK